MVCRNCGNENVDYARFCLTCGTAFWQQEQQQPVQPPAPKVGDDPWMRATVPGKLPMAIAAAWVGVVSLLCCVLGPVAVVLSIVALVQLSHDSEREGKVQAIFGLITGSVATLIAIILLIGNLYG